MNSFKEAGIGLPETGSILLLHVVYTIAAGKREEFYNKLHDYGIIEKSRQENGNFQYDYYFPADNENDILLVELWSGVQAQKNHLATAHYQELQALKREYVVHVEIEKYIAEKMA